VEQTVQLSRYFVLAFLMPLLGFSWLLLAALDLGGPSGPRERIFVGFLFGTMFGQAMLAAAWTALGPGPLLWRLPLSLGWIAALLIAFMINIGVHNHGPDVGVALTMGGCLMGQWLLVQVPAWGLAVGYGVRLRHWSDPPESIRERQFGIRQLMILTAIVSIVLGVGRVAIGKAISEMGEGDSERAVVFVFLAVVGIVMSLPLLMAVLLPRGAWLATLVVLSLIAIGTWYELPLVMMVYTGGPGPDIWHLTFINAFQAAWVVAVAGLLRLCGYGISHPRGESPFASTSEADR
jgi:hypothetical protein